MGGPSSRRGLFSSATPVKAMGGGGGLCHELITRSSTMVADRPSRHSRRETITKILFP